MGFEKSISDVLLEYKNRIIKLNNMKHNLSKEQLEHRLRSYNDSLDIVIYSLLQEGMKVDETIQKKNK